MDLHEPTVFAFDRTAPEVKRHRYDIIDIGPFFGYECAATGILARTSFCEDNIPEHTEYPKIRANDIVILVMFECTRANT
jgi:hypothetical protein